MTNADGKVEGEFVAANWIAVRRRHCGRRFFECETRACTRRSARARFVCERARARE